MKYLLKNGTVISGAGTRKQDVLVEGEKIIKVGEELSQPDAKVVDVSGKLLFPGFIDGHTHHKGYPVKDMPPMIPPAHHQELLSAREIEVLVLITKGLINKEIADKLNISLTTVITHRKNITEKLGIKSVSGLTIYRQFT